MMNNGTSPTRRHNGYGVDLSGAPANLNAAMLALNSHQRLAAALRRLVGFVHDLDRAHCGLADFAEGYPDLEDAYPEAVALLQGLGIDPFEER